MPFSLVTLKMKILPDVDIFEIENMFLPLIYSCSVTYFSEHPFL